MIGHTYERYFKSMVKSDMIQHFPLTDTDVTNAHAVLGTNLSGTRGNTVQQETGRLMMDYVASPKDFIKLHKFVIIVADVMFVINVPSLTTMSFLSIFLLFNTFLSVQLIS